MKIRSALIRIHWLLATQFGFDPLKLLRSLRGVSRYLHDLSAFRKGYSGRILLKPCLQDWHGEGGTTKNEYFWQDLIVARKIFEANPSRHVDVGSRVDGFVAHIASFREIEVLDVRPIHAQVPGVVFRKVDLMQPFAEGYCDSLSCLHAIEHFGLGRYGDALDPDGYNRGISNMAKLLKPGGRFYLSVPIGRERVEFNANRVFEPFTIIERAEAAILHIEELTVVPRTGQFYQAQLNEKGLSQLARVAYNLGIFVFTKQKP